MPHLHRPVVAILADDDRSTVRIPTTRPAARDHQPERRCANSACNCVLARDNPHHLCSPCQRASSHMPQAIADYLNDR